MVFPSLNVMNYMKAIKLLSLFGCVMGAAILEAAKPTSVVLILADDMSPHLSMLGTPGIQTPHIDRLARAGVYFSSAFSASASCSPSRTAILTGMWPHSNGNWRNVHTPPLNRPEKEFTRETSVRDRVGISDEVATLPELLQSHGYFTAITQKLHLSPAWRYPFNARNPVQSQPERFHSAIKDFIRKAGTKPFFIQANVAAPHRPYGSHLKRNPEQGLPLEDLIELPPFLPNTEGVRRDMQEYFACVEIADACVGAILAALEDMGARDETLVIFTSDQGMPIHHAKASGYPGGTRIPLAIAGPRIRKGISDSTPVSQIDYAPTILDYCGITVPVSMQGDSLMPILEGGQLEEREYVFAEHNSHGPDPREHFPQRAVTDGLWYYVLNLNPEKTQRLPADLNGEDPWGNHAYEAILGEQVEYPFQSWFLTRFSEPRPSEHLFQLDIDPWGVNDLAGHPATTEVLHRLRAVMEKWRQATSDIDKSPLEIPEIPRT